MLHSIPTGKHGPNETRMTRAIEACVHCGFCLAACPTYRELGQEMDSPRGRIVLMKEVLEGALDWKAAQPHIDRCLGCLACEPACPSGVPYRELISPFRSLAQKHFVRTPGETVRRWLAAGTVPHPERFQVAARVGRVGRMFPALVPAALKPMLALLPEDLPESCTWPEVVPAEGERRARVALLLGCAQQVLDPDINRATIEVLTRQGVEVHLPRGQGCCGGLAWHTGEGESAQAFALRNIEAFAGAWDALLTNAAGCGSAMHEYPLMLEGTRWQRRAEELSRKVEDVSVFLHRLGWRRTPRGLGGARRVAYQDACHLAHAQGVRKEPRALLRAIPGVELVELPEAHLCCGSAGSYNLDQPEIAASLGEQKARAVMATGADVLVSGNIGCLTQLRFHLARLGSRIRILHTMQILRDSDRS